MLRYDRRESVVVRLVLPRELVRRAFDEAQLGGGDPEGLEDGYEDVLVVFCAVGDPVECRFEVVEEGVYVWKEGDETSR